jgi:hypothetical protein
MNTLASEVVCRGGTYFRMMDLIATRMNELRYTRAAVLPMDERYWRDTSLMRRIVAAQGVAS